MGEQLVIDSKSTDGIIDSEDASFSVRQYVSSQIIDFVSTDQAKEMINKLDRTNPSLGMCPWFISSVIDDRSNMLVVEDGGRAVGFFIYTLEHRFGKDICYAHRYDLFPESIDVRSIVGISHDQVAKQIVQTLKNKKYMIDLDGVRKDSSLIRVVENTMGYTRVDTSSSGRYLKTFPSVEDFLAKSSSKFRFYIKKTIRKAEKLGITHEIIKDVDNKTVESLFDLHREVFHDSSELLKQLDSFRKIIDGANQNNSVFMIACMHENNPVTMYLMVRDQDTFYLINSGRSTDKQYGGLGKLAMIYAIKAAFDLGASSIYLMRPDSELKEKMGAELVEYIRLRSAINHPTWWIYRSVQEISHWIKSDKKKDCEHG